MNDVIGLKLKRLRNERGFTQEQVAEHLHISQSAYARIENGESNSWANHLETLSNLFEVEPIELLKQDNIIVNHSQQGGNGAFIINQLSDKLIEQYEARLKEKDELIAFLKAKLHEG